MWIVAAGGFISVVEYDPRKTRDKKSKHATVENDLSEYHAADETTLSSHLMVRARVREDLKFLEDAGVQLEEKVEVYEDLKADYQWRCVVSRNLLKHAMAAQIDGIDYWSHVKESLTSRMPPLPKGSRAGSRQTALMGFWSGHASWQANSPYGGYSGSTTTYVTPKLSDATVKGLNEAGKTTYTDPDGHMWKLSVYKKDGSWHRDYNGEWDAQKAKGTTNYSYLSSATIANLNAANQSFYVGDDKRHWMKNDKGVWVRDWDSETAANAAVTGEYVSAFGAVEAQPALLPGPASIEDLMADADGVIDWEDLDKDNPWGLNDAEVAIASGNPTEETMRSQIVDLLSISGADGNPDDIVELLIESFGTVDIDTLKPEDVLDAVVDSQERINKALES